MMPEMPDGFDPSQGGMMPEMPDGFDPSQGGMMPEMPDGFDPSQGGMMPEMPDGFDPSQIPGESGEQETRQTLPGQAKGIIRQKKHFSEQDALTENKTEDNMLRPSRNNSQMPGGDFNFSMDNMGPAKEGTSGWLWITVSVLILCVGLVIVKKYR